MSTSNSSFRLSEQNSYGEYLEEQLINQIEKAVSPYSAIDRKNVRRTPVSITIPTKLNIGHISKQDLINSLARHGNAKVKVPPDNEVFIECQRPNTFPAAVYGAGIMAYSLWSLFVYQMVLKGLIYTFIV
jgi:hypothetical protein